MTHSFPTRRSSDLEVITPFDAPFKAGAGIAILRGNLAPDGAVIKPSAASPELMQHTGRAVVFESVEEMHAGVNDDSLDIDAGSIMVLKKDRKSTRLNSSH